MVVWCLSAFLCFITLSCTSSMIAERRLFCSSEQLNIWYTFDGPLYYLSVTGYPCSTGVTLFTVTYTVIPMFTITRIGYLGRIHYNKQLWLELEQPDIICEDLKICQIIKGETLHETCPMYIKKFHGPEGEYQIYLTVNITDDLENKVILQFNGTMELKNDGNNNNKYQYVPQLGGL